MPDPYRTTCERCLDLEASLKVANEAKDRVLKTTGGLEEELRQYRRRTWTDRGERLFQTLVYGALLGGAVLGGFYLHGWAKQPDQCRSSTYLMAKDRQHICAPGARITTEDRKDDYILVRCECVDAPPTSSATPAK